MKKVLVMSDMHCGALTGLTPPGWQMQPAEETEVTKRDKLIHIQRACWDFYDGMIRKHGPFDVIIVNGDCIDGTGHRSGGTEQATLDRLHQCEIAEYCIAKARSKKTKIYITIGTAYHVGEAEDFEMHIANVIGATKVGSHEWIDVEGTIFDCKHHIGSSAVPHGRHTAVARDRLWNVLWAERALQPKANVIIRSHVHYYNFCGGPDWIGMTTPALQGYGTKFGSRRMSGIVDFGVVIFECDHGHNRWTPIIANLPELRASVVKA